MEVGINFKRRRCDEPGARTVDQTGARDMRETARARTTYREALRFALQAARRLATRSQPIGRDTQSNPRKQPLARLTVDSSLSR